MLTFPLGFTPRATVIRTGQPQQPTPRLIEVPSIKHRDLTVIKIVGADEVQRMLGPIRAE